MSNDNNDPNDFSIIFEHDYQPELDMGEQVRYLVDSLVRHGAFLDEIIAECVFRLRRDDPELGTEEEAFYLTVAAEATRLCMLVIQTAFAVFARIQENSSNQHQGP